MTTPNFSLERIKRSILRRRNAMTADFREDGFAVKSKSLGFLEDPRFKSAWGAARELCGGPSGSIPSIRWRAHIACWAASVGLQLEGDFIECGTNTGILAKVVCEYHEFAKIDRKFYLCDTFAGMPIISGMLESEVKYAIAANKGMYSDVFAQVGKAFSNIPNVVLCQGILPASLAQLHLRKIAYLSMDLNSAVAEKLTIEILWPLLTTGAVVLLDDYAHKGHEAQYKMWNDFAASKGLMVATLPSGQGLLVKGRT